MGKKRLIVCEFLLVTVLNDERDGCYWVWIRSGISLYVDVIDWLQHVAYNPR